MWTDGSFKFGSKTRILGELPSTCAGGVRNDEGLAVGAGSALGKRTLAKICRPLAPKVQYRLRAVGIRGMLGQTLPSELPVSAAGAQPDRRPPTPTKLPSGAVPIPIKRD